MSKTTFFYSRFSENMGHFLIPVSFLYEQNGRMGDGKKKEFFKLSLSHSNCKYQKNIKVWRKERH